MGDRIIVKADLAETYFEVKPNMRQIWTSIKNAALKINKKRIATQKNSDGTRFARTVSGKKALKKIGQLKYFNTKVSSNAVTISSKVPFADEHQYGIKRSAKKKAVQSTADIAKVFRDNEGAVWAAHYDKTPQKKKRPAKRRAEPKQEITKKQKKKLVKEYTKAQEKPKKKRYPKREVLALSNKDSEAIAEQVGQKVAKDVFS